VWVSPELVIEDEFRRHTENGLLRQASLKGRRADRHVKSLRPARRNAARISSRGSASREQ
jgi:bifunctional non-homologous end joining protein LigD